MGRGRGCAGVRKDFCELQLGVSSNSATVLYGWCVKVRLVWRERSCSVLISKWSRYYCLWKQKSFQCHRGHTHATTTPTDEQKNNNNFLSVTCRQSPRFRLGRDLWKVAFLPDRLLRRPFTARSAECSIGTSNPKTSSSTWPTTNLWNSPTLDWRRWCEMARTGDSGVRMWPG